jgi:hypothetical protein
MNTLTCYLCGGHIFYAIEFRNTKILTVSYETVELVCPHCGLAVFQIREGRAERAQECQKRFKLSHRIRVWLKHFKGKEQAELERLGKPGEDHRQC